MRKRSEADIEMDEIWNNRQMLFYIQEKVVFDRCLTGDDLRIYMLIQLSVNRITYKNVIETYNQLSLGWKINKLRFNNCIHRLIRRGYIEKYEVNGKMYLKTEYQ